MLWSPTFDLSAEFSWTNTRLCGGHQKAESQTVAFLKLSDIQRVTSLVTAFTARMLPCDPADCGVKCTPCDGNSAAAVAAIHTWEVFSREDALELASEAGRLVFTDSAGRTAAAGGPI